MSHSPPEWVYMDAAGVEQGPFAESLMVAWRAARLLPDTVRVRASDWPSELFVDIATVARLNAAPAETTTWNAEPSPETDHGETDDGSPADVAQSERVCAPSCEQALSAAEPHVAEPRADDPWEYRDPTGAVHGPFARAALETWFASRMLPDELPLRRHNAEPSSAFVVARELAPFARAIEAARATARPAHTTLAPDQLERAEWCYADASGVEHGPYAMSLMLDWFGASELVSHLAVRHMSEPDYRPFAAHPAFARALGHPHAAWRPAQHARVARVESAASETQTSSDAPDYALRASFSTKTGRMTGAMEAAGLSHWAKKGLPEDREMRQLAMVTSLSSFVLSPEDAAREAAREARSKAKASVAFNRARRAKGASATR